MDKDKQIEQLEQRLKTLEDAAKAQADAAEKAARDEKYRMSMLGAENMRWDFSDYIRFDDGRMWHNPVNTAIMFDKWGINPDFMKLFPNKVLNSGFEWCKIDKYGKLKPMYWVGDGICTADSNWEGTYALQLRPGQKMEQGTIDGHTLAGADPKWWDDGPTRVSFRHKGGKVRVRVKIYPVKEPVKEGGD